MAMAICKMEIYMRMMSCVCVCVLLRCMSADETKMWQLGLKLE